MNIVLVSTYAVECGIATYTEALAQALKSQGHSVTVLAEIRDKQPMSQTIDGVPVYRIWARSMHNSAMYGLSSIIRAIDSSPTKPDVVHFQHEFGLFPDSYGLTQLMEQLIARGIRVVTTLHTVLAPPEGTGFFPLLIGEVIVHTDEAAAALLTHWVPDHVRVVPHGLTPGVVVPARRTNGRGSSILVPGFVGRNKGTLEILEGFAEHVVRTQDWLSTLRILGLCRDERFELELRQNVARYCLDRRVILDLGFQTVPTVHEAFAWADFVILGAGETTPYSASGQLSGCISHGVPVLAKNVPIYRSGGDCGIVLYEEDELAPLIGALSNLGLRERLQQKHAIVAATRTWDIIAQKHMEIYSG